VIVSFKAIASAIIVYIVISILTRLLVAFLLGLGVPGLIIAMASMILAAMIGAISMLLANVSSYHLRKQNFFYA